MPFLFLRRFLIALIIVVIAWIKTSSSRNSVALLEKQAELNKKEETFEDLVKQMAQQILQENKNFIGKDVAEESIKRIEDKNTNEEGGNVNEEVKKVRKTRKVRKAE